MKLGLVCTPFSDENLQLARQISCTDIVYYDMAGMPETVEGLLEAKAKVERQGLRLSVMEAFPRMDEIVCAGPGRDEQIEVFKRCIRNMGEAGIGVMCYNFMHWGCRVGRSSYQVPVRGGALSSRFRRSEWDDSPVGEISPEEVWANYEYFIKAVIPTCEEANVRLALHPDDPPVAKLRGFSRVFNTVEAFERMPEICPSLCNGITFDVSLFSMMGADVPATIKKLGQRIHFFHFRDVVGKRDDYTEVFHDQGSTNHMDVMKALKESGFDGVIRPDHVPLMAGEAGHAEGDKAEGYYSGKASGYTMQGRMFACGYLRGLMEAVGVPNEADIPIPEP